MKCLICHGNCELLGKLGSIVYYKCRYCGMIQYKNRKPKEKDIFGRMQKKKKIAINNG